ncbi:MAG: TlpA disulfide reductase family protein [Elusimicrobia bacterium]|nr:TlpA disulfide reductase family protein [Elusimicrobiota bacterium]
MTRILFHVLSLFLLQAPVYSGIPASCDIPLINAAGGPPVRLSALKEKVVLVYFWTTNCVPCRIHKPFIEELQKRYGDRSFAVQSVNTGEKPDAVMKYLKSHPTTLSVALDPSGTLERALLLVGQPAMALFVADGGLLWSAAGFGPSTRDDLVWRIENYLPAKPASADKR